ncbi:flavodoxin family protein [Sediminibacillus massiliensis]|uniref:flavodoxin family protein n=1 Tax=Sediminibacillus massiliensis TaxID=1926277 RepID=UPI000988395B|nr:flavodoxin family protein [Sediminibacillus massiliensis]
MSRKLKALILNCSLKKSNEPSNTDAMLNDFIKIFDGKQVESEVIRVADYQVAYGIASDMGDGDEWPQIWEKVKEADILLVGTPVWLGEKSSISKLVLERLDGGSSETNEKGQSIFYNKVAGAAVTGNEDGAKNAGGDLIFGLAQLGYTVPPNPLAYWVGEAGPGPSYVEAEGYKSEFTQSTIQMAGHNLVHLASILNEQPIPAEGNAS